MGQYYKPIILKEDKKTPIAYASCYDFGNGAKLMEHSYIGNSFVGFIETRLLNNPSHLVWAGDYADAEAFKGVPNKIKKAMLKENEYYKNNIEQLENEGINLHSICNYGSVPKLTHDIVIPKDKSKYDIDYRSAIPNLTESRYIVNHDKGLFVDKRNVKVIEGDTYGNKIHPLPLLTCEGNNRGGGDFGGNEKGIVGTWSRDLISIESKKPKGFQELIFDLKE